MSVLMSSLTEVEQAIARETERERLVGLDEDELVDLRTRVRRLVSA